ncbi:unnamed protein product [Prunus brigantina]
MKDDFFVVLMLMYSRYIGGEVLLSDEDDGQLLWMIMEFKAIFLSRTISYQIPVQVDVLEK